MVKECWCNVTLTNPRERVGDWSILSGERASEAWGKATLSSLSVTYGPQNRQDNRAVNTTLVNILARSLTGNRLKLSNMKQSIESHRKTYFMYRLPKWTPSDIFAVLATRVCYRYFTFTQSLLSRIVDEAELPFGRLAELSEIALRDKRWGLSYIFHSASVTCMRRI